jgi:phage shock protein PspC (stress-responsive transcriptional regulator)
MNKVITINLNGNAYQLEEDGYEALRTYLDVAAGRLEGNPDKDEIIADIEQAIADKFRAVLGAAKTVVVTREVNDVIAAMGPVQDASGANDAPRSAAAGAAPGSSARPGAAAGPGFPGGNPKRLYRIREGAMIGGVCNGLAAYLGIDVTLLRILFAFLALTFGSGVLLYIVMMIVIPPAITPDEMAAAEGAPSTAEEFIRRARAGYYDGVKHMGDPRAYREWKRRFKQDMRQFGRQFRKDMRWNRWNWHWSWHHPQTPAPDIPPHPGTWFAAPFIGVLATVITILCFFSIFSLIMTGAVFGIMLPMGIPLWLGIVLLIVFFRLLKWPLYAMRHEMYGRGRYGWGPAGPFSYLWHSCAWFAFIILMVWLADRYSWHFHDALVHLHHAGHVTVQALRDWWSRQ